MNQAAFLLANRCRCSEELPKMEGFIDGRVGGKLLAKEKKELFQARALSLRGQRVL